MRSSLTADTRLYGPLPTGARSKAAGSALTTASGTILMTEMRALKPGKGYLSLNWTVESSLAETESMKGMKPANSDLFAGSRTRWKENTTSAVVTGSPLWNVAPSRSCTSYVVSSTLTGSALARARYGSRVAGCSSVRPSKMCRLAACGVAPVASIGSKPVES